MIYSEKPADFKPRFEVASCFLEHDGRILLLLRQDHKPQGNTWSLPAGKVENGESPISAIAREMREETGYSAPVEAFTHAHTVFVTHDGYSFPYHMFHHVLSSIPEITLEDSAHKEYRWVTPEEALSLPLMPDEDECIRLFYRTLD